VECGFQGYFAGRVQLGQIAAIYCWVSTSDQDCKRQETELVAFAAKAGYAVAGVWKETESRSKNDRQLLIQVLSLVQARKIALNLVTELTRWGRINIGFVSYTQRFAILGRLSNCVNRIAVYLATPHGKLIATLMAGLAEFERDLFRERVDLESRQQRPVAWCLANDLGSE
jgi:DNA invertase Pin-like site-specific DNA recombinase